MPVSGWFKAPATGQYRFYLSCNSACALYMNHTTPFDASSVSATEPVTTKIANKTGNFGWRNYHYQADDGHYSAWVQLTANESYYIKGETGNNDGQISVAVEIKEDVPQAMVSTCVNVTTTNADNTTTTTEQCT